MVRTGLFASIPTIVSTCPRPCRNTQIEDTCIVFRQWHISSHFVFVFSYIAIIFISLGYEYLRAYQRIVDRRIAQALSRGKGRDKSAVSGCSTVVLSRIAQMLKTLACFRVVPRRFRLGMSSPSLQSLRVIVTMISISTPVPFYPRVLRAALYGAQIFVSFSLMLVFMTYNVGSLA